MTRATVIIELEAGAQARDLASGRVFVPGCGLELADECELIVCGANHELAIPARVVFVDEHGGAGLELLGFSSELKAQLAELEPIAASPVDVVDVPALDDAGHDAPPEDELASGTIDAIPLLDVEGLGDSSDDLAIPVAGDAVRTAHAAYDRQHDPDAAPHLRRTRQVPHDDPDELASLAYGEENSDEADTLDPEMPPRDELDAGPDPDDPDNADDDHHHDDDAATVDDSAEPHEHASAARRFARNVHERLRGLNLAAQIKMATTGEMHERIVLERLYGKNVWETLLRNPRLTAPEVSRIARYGSLPRVLLEIILANNAWLQVPEVRRALLCNPRLGTDQIMKVLRLMPKHELKLAAIQTAYPQAVRNAAKMITRSP